MFFDKEKGDETVDDVDTNMDVMRNDADVNIQNKDSDTTLTLDKETEEDLAKLYAEAEAEADANEQNEDVDTTLTLDKETEEDLAKLYAEAEAEVDANEQNEDVDTTLVRTKEKVDYIERLKKLMNPPKYQEKGKQAYAVQKAKTETRKAETEEQRIERVIANVFSEEDVKKLQETGKESPETIKRAYEAIPENILRRAAPMLEQSEVKAEEIKKYCNHKLLNLLFDGKKRNKNAPSQQEFVQEIIAAEKMGRG